MQHHEEMADAISEVRASLEALRDENDIEKIKAGLAANQARLEKIESDMASRRTMMQLRMQQPQSSQ